MSFNRHRSGDPLLSWLDFDTNELREQAAVEADDTAGKFLTSRP